MTTIRVKSTSTQTVRLKATGPPGPPSTVATEVPQAVAEAGTSQTFYIWSPERWRQAAVTWLATLVARNISAVPITEATIPHAADWNSSVVTASAQVHECTAAVTVTLEAQANRASGFQFGVLNSSSGDVTYASTGAETYGKESTFTKQRAGSTVWIVIRSDGKWHISGLSS